MKANKILITLPFDKKIITSFDACVAKLEAKGYEVVLDPRGRALKEPELMEYAQDIVADICSTDQWNHAALAAAPNLRAISRMGAGYDSIDVEAATEKGTGVAVTVGANAPDVAEYAFSMMLALGRRLTDADAMARRGEWKRVFGHSLYGRTIGILGLGNIGKQLVKLCEPFKMRILAYEKYPDLDFAAKYGVTFTDVKTLVSESDFISVHLLLSPETRGIIGAAEFSMMKPATVIINCARGGIVDEKALIAALAEKKIWGAGLDVFEEEPPKDLAAFEGLENLILSPHTAGMTFEGRARLVEMAFDNAIDMLEGRPCRGMLNTKIFDK